MRVDLVTGTELVEVRVGLGTGEGLVEVRVDFSTGGLVEVRVVLGI